MLKNRITIKLTLNDDTIEKEIKFRYERKVYTNINYDITIIEILPKIDEISNFLNFDENQNPKEGESIYVLHYPEGKKASASYGVIESLEENGYEFTHLCSTSEGSSGAPILSLETNKVIGIHSIAYKNLDEKQHDYNGGKLMKEAIKQFQEGINSFIMSDNTLCFINLIKSPLTLLHLWEGNNLHPLNAKKLINIEFGYSKNFKIFYIKVEDDLEHKIEKKGDEKYEIYLEKKEDKKIKEEKEKKEIIEEKSKFKIKKRKKLKKVKKEKRSESEKKEKSFSRFSSHKSPESKKKEEKEESEKEEVEEINEEKKEEKKKEDKKLEKSEKKRPFEFEKKCKKQNLKEDKNEEILLPKITKTIPNENKIKIKLSKKLFE